MRNFLLAGSVATLALSFAAIGHATPVALTGNYLEVGISDYGTFGSDGSTEPGLLHDPTGMGNFYPNGIANDYLTPGNPHDGFAINSTQTGFLQNDNNGAGSDFGTTSPTQTGPTSATWSGSTASGVGITNSYSFGANNEQIQITTTLTNNTGSELDGLYFGRSEDPDPDLNTYGTYATNNTRGDATTSPANLVSGAGAYTGLTIGILNTSGTFASNTSISYGCCSTSDPVAVFNGTDYADYGANYPIIDNGDYGLQMAWNLGTLAAGSSDTITYEYVFGTNQATVTMPSGVPEPGTWALMMAGIAMIGAALRFNRKRGLEALAA